MSEQNKFQNSQEEIKEVEPVVATKESRKYMWLAITSILLTAIAWIVGSYNGVAALIISAVAIITGMLSLKSHRKLIRNTAITAIIASAVLLVVILAFYIVIYLGLKTI